MSGIKPGVPRCEPLAVAEAIHSQMGRPERLGGLVVATGQWSRSTITATVRNRRCPEINCDRDF
jgi:hypothetical protein